MEMEYIEFIRGGPIDGAIMNVPVTSRMFEKPTHTPGVYHLYTRCEAGAKFVYDGLYNKSFPAP